MPGVRVAARLLSAAPGVTLTSNINVTGDDGLATFSGIKLRGSPADYLIAVKAEDFDVESEARVAIRVRDCVPGEVKPMDAPDTCMLW
jgi:hypothetical protein